MKRNFKVGEKALFAYYENGQGTHLESVKVATKKNALNETVYILRVLAPNSQRSHDYDESNMIKVDSNLKMAGGFYVSVDLSGLELKTLDCSGVNISRGLVCSNNPSLTTVIWPDTVAGVDVDGTSITDFHKLSVKDFICESKNLGKSLPKVSNEFSIVDESGMLWAAASTAKWLSVGGDKTGITSILIKNPNLSIFRAKLNLILEGKKKYARF